MSALARYLAFRRTLPPRPPLSSETVNARGLTFAVWRTPPIANTIPLVCVNGGLLFDHQLLWPALAPLAAHRQLILYDQRGRGQSTAPPGLNASRIEFDAGDLNALRIALDLPTWDVLGHSWGGGIAMLAASQRDNGIRRLVLVNAVGVTSEWLPPLHDAALHRLQGDAQRALAALSTQPLNEPDLAVHAQYAQTFFPAWFADPSFAAAVAPPRGTSPTGAAVAARLRRDGYDWRETVRDVAAPTLVVHGAADVLPLAEAERTARTIRQARLAVIPDAGHNPFWESPQQFFTVVNDFLANTIPGESPPNH